MTSSLKYGNHGSIFWGSHCSLYAYLHLVSVTVWLLSNLTNHPPLPFDSLHAWPLDSIVTYLGPSIKYVMLFWDNFDPSLCHTSQDFPKVCHTSRTPRFLVGLVKNNGQKPSVQILSVVRGGLVRGFCQGVLCLEGFCPFPLLLEYICYKRKLNITLNFKFHMYDKNLKVWRHMFSTPPSPVTNCHTFSDPLPLEHDILYGLSLCCFPTHF